MQSATALRNDLDAEIGSHAQVGFETFERRVAHQDETKGNAASHA